MISLELDSDPSERIGLKVEILDNDGKGELRIRYTTLAQLDDLRRRLSGRA